MRRAVACPSRDVRMIYLLVLEAAIAGVPVTVICRVFQFSKPSVVPVKSESHLPARLGRHPPHQRRLGYPPRTTRLDTGSSAMSLTRRLTSWVVPAALRAMGEGKRCSGSSTSGLNCSNASPRRVATFRSPRLVWPGSIPIRAGHALQILCQ